MHRFTKLSKKSEAIISVMIKALEANYSKLTSWNKKGNTPVAIWSGRETDKFKFYVTEQFDKEEKILHTQIGLLKTPYGIYVNSIAFDNGISQISVNITDGVVNGSPGKQEAHTREAEKWILEINDKFKICN